MSLDIPFAAPGAHRALLRGTSIDLDAAIASYLLHLGSRNLSDGTRRLYANELRRFEDFIVAAGMPTDVAAVGREHIDLRRRAVRARSEARHCQSQLPKPQAVLEVARRRGRNSRVTDGSDATAQRPG